MPNKTDDDSTTLDTPHQEQDGQQLVDRLEHELQENPDPELVERVVQSPILKQTFIAECSGQLNPDTWLGRSSAFAGGIPSLC